MKKRLLTSIASAVMLTSVATPVVSNAINIVHSQKVSAATTDEQAEFLNKAAKQAVKAAKKYGTYPSVMIAQAIVESGWGQSGLAVNANNLFGMKADDSWTGATYTSKTREEDKIYTQYYSFLSIYPKQTKLIPIDNERYRLGIVLWRLLDHCFVSCCFNICYNQREADKTGKKR